MLICENLPVACATHGIGLGMRPDLTGQGQGSTYARAVVAYGLRQYGDRWLRVTVAAFNQRAQRVWQRLGFKPVEQFFKIGTEQRL